MLPMTSSTTTTKPRTVWFQKRENDVGVTRIDRPCKRCNLVILRIDCYLIFRIKKPRKCLEIGMKEERYELGRPSQVGGPQHIKFEFKS